MFPGSDVFWICLQFFSKFPEMDFDDVLDRLFQDTVKTLRLKKNLGAWALLNFLRIVGVFCRFNCSRIPAMEF